MKQHLPRFVLGLVILVLLLGHAAKIYQIGFVSRLDFQLYDTKVRLTMPRTVDDRIVIVDIDEKSLGEVGRWPWSRDKMSTLVTKLFKQGILVLGFDVVFAEPDNSSGLKSLEVLAKSQLKDNGSFQTALKDMRGQLDFDARFAETLKGKPIVLGYYMSSKEGGTSSGAIPEPVLPAGTFAGRNIAFTTWATHGGNLPEFQRAAASGGHFNPLFDFDGVSRRVPLLVEYQGAYYESLALAMTRALLGYPKLVPGYPQDEYVSNRNYGGLEWLDMTAAGGTMRIPVDENVAALIPYRGPQGSFRYIPAADVLADRVNPEELKGKIVLIGTTAPGLMDLRSTPVDSAYPGVEIHANLIAGFLDGTIKHKPSYVLGADVMLTLIIGGVMVFLLPLLSPFRATIATALVLLFTLSINFGFWHLEHMVLPLAGSLMLIVILYAMNMSWGYFVESRTKQKITGLFGQYVPSELVDEMSKNPEQVSMEGDSREMTILFSDVRGFTTISEGMEPKELSLLMNEFLTPLSRVIYSHRGTIDKYMGDCIMAFWGAPLPDARHAYQAVLSGLEMQRKLSELQPHFAERGWPPIHIGVGINTGRVSVGNMGSEVRVAYTVMGDAVNLASRLEGITKEYGAGVLVGEKTREETPEFVYRELDLVRVKGKDKPVAIFEPLGLAAEVTQATQDEAKMFHQALRMYRKQEWDKAELQLFNLLKMSPGSKLYEVYAERVVYFRNNPPGENWDGVFVFKTK